MPLKDSWRNIIKNRLLMFTVYAVIAYVIPSVLMPYRVTAGITAFLLMASGIAVLGRYLPTTWRIVFHGYRGYNTVHAGSHLAVYGITLLALGAVYQGTYALVWLIVGSPAAWSGTPISGFGRYMMFFGFWLWFISPDLKMPEFKMPSKAFLIVGLAALMIVIFLIARDGWHDEHGWLLPIPRVQLDASSIA